MNRLLAAKIQKIAFAHPKAKAEVIQGIIRDDCPMLPPPSLRTIRNICRKAPAAKSMARRFGKPWPGHTLAALAKAIPSHWRTPLAEIDDQIAALARQIRSLEGHFAAQPKQHQWCGPLLDHIRALDGALLTLKAARREQNRIARGPSARKIPFMKPGVSP